MRLLFPIEILLLLNSSRLFVRCASVFDSSEAASHLQKAVENEYSHDADFEKRTDEDLEASSRRDLQMSDSDNNDSQYKDEIQESRRMQQQGGSEQHGRVLPVHSGGVSGQSENQQYSYNSKTSKSSKSSKGSKGSKSSYPSQSYSLASVKSYSRPQTTEWSWSDKWRKTDGNANGDVWFKWKYTSGENHAPAPQKSLPNYSVPQKRYSYFSKPGSAPAPPPPPHYFSKPVPNPTRTPTIPRPPIFADRTDKPTNAPIEKPTPKPVTPPTDRPTASPTKQPTVKPVRTPRPTETPTPAPSRVQTPRPSMNRMTPRPTPMPTTGDPTFRPTQPPTPAPTKERTPRPTMNRMTPPPTLAPTDNPTPRPTKRTPRPTEATPRPTRGMMTRPTPAPTPLATNMDPTPRPTRRTPRPTEAPTPVPTRSSTPKPTEPVPTVCDPPISPSQRETDLRDIVSQVSSTDDLADPESPQFDAFEWLLDIDGAEVCPGDPNVVQRYVLAVFYFAMNGNEWSQCNARISQSLNLCPGVRWLEPVNECLWFGITCVPRDNGNVYRIELEDNNLVGSNLPTEISELVDLWRIDLDENPGIQSSIPEEYGDLIDLVELSIDNNSVRGGIRGPLPGGLFDAPLLGRIGLKGNEIDGAIPEEIAQADSLAILDLSVNELSGPLPPQFPAVLEFMILDDNQIDGPIPPGFDNLANLQALALARNGINGPIPEFVGSLSSLETINLFDNEMTGQIPASLGNLQNLESLFLHFNQFTGTMPQSICDLNLNQLTSDCAPGGPVVCTCCTLCF